MTPAVERLRAALEAHGCRPRPNGSGFKAWCPVCQAGGDHKSPGLSFETGNGTPLVLRCWGPGRCQAEAVLTEAGLRWADLLGDAPQSGREPARREVAAYDYVDEDGRLLFQVVRFQPKDFRQRRPDGKGGWIWNLDGVRRVLYRFPSVLDVVSRGGTVYLVEGEKDADAINSFDPDATGYVATCNPGGAGKWRTEYAEVLRGAGHILVWQDRDDAGRKHAREVAESVHGKVGELRIVEAREGKDASDHLAAGHALEDAVSVEWPAKPATLAHVVEVFRRSLYLPDARALYVTLGAYIANRQEGEPLWLLIVGESGKGKTETVNVLAGLEGVHAASTLTEASLLSGTSKKDKAKDARGGLLREIGERGVLLLKDFTSVLSMNRETRAGVLGALREIADGSYVRHVGTDGGRTLAWQGRIGFIGGVTPILDRYHEVMSTLGERFLLFRMPEVEARELGRSALRHSRTGAAMRRELAEAVEGLMSGIAFDQEAPGLTAEQEERILTLACYVAAARSPIVRDGYRREVELIPGREAPTRLAIMLSRLLDGLLALGLDEAAACDAVVKTGLDSIPALRRKALDALADGTERSTADIATALGHPSVTTRRTLEDLACYGMTARRSAGGPKGDRWSLSHEALKLRASVSETSEGMHSGEPTFPLNEPEHTFDDFSETLFQEEARS